MKGKSKAERADLRGGAFIMLPDCLLKSDAYRTASFRAKAALNVLLARHTGFNNGKITMSVEELAFGLACQNFAANAAAMAELQSRGIIELMKDHPRGVRLAREYRVTFIPVGSNPATHDYVSWRVGDPGTGKKRVVAIANETRVSTAMTANERKLSTAMTATEKKGNDGKPPFLPEASFAMTATHIGNHVGSSAQSDKVRGEKADGPHNNTNGRRYGAPPISAAPPAEELRERVLSHLASCGRGSQGRLAETAGIPPGTFSKFIKHGGPLSERARIRLTCAFPKAENVERRAGAMS